MVWLLPTGLDGLGCHHEQVLEEDWCQDPCSMLALSSLPSTAGLLQSLYIHQYYQFGLYI